MINRFTAAHAAALAPLFAYPMRHPGDQARGAIPALDVAGRAHLGQFAEAAERCSLSQLQEGFIQCFDLCADATLDLGWHLFGEDYARGEFLVKLRQENRQYGVEEDGELPDHLRIVLTLLSRYDDGDREKFVAAYLAPALGKIRAAIKDDSNPYVHIVEALMASLEVECPKPFTKLEVLSE